MGSNTNQWKPTAGDRKIRQFDLGGNGPHAPYDFKIMSGCALSGLTGQTLTVGNGRVKCAGFLVDFNADTYDPVDNATSYLYYELNLTKNASGKVIGFTSNFAINASDASAADYYFKVAEITTDGAGDITAIDGGEDDTWYARPRTKILPSLFVSNDAANPETGANPEITTAGAAADLEYSVEIPQGFKATKLRIWASATKTIQVSECQIYTATPVSRGSGDTTAEIDITDVEASGTNYLLFRVLDLNGQSVYGGYVTLELSAA